LFKMGALDASPVMHVMVLWPYTSRRFLLASPSTWSLLG
jgi:hypothetical protein